MATVQQYFDLEDRVFGRGSWYPPTSKEGSFLPLCFHKLCIECSLNPTYWPIFGEILRDFSINLEQYAEAVNSKYQGTIFVAESGMLQLTKERIGCDVLFFDILRLAHALIPD